MVCNISGTLTIRAEKAFPAREKIMQSIFQSINTPSNVDAAPTKAKKRQWRIGWL